MRLDVQRDLSRSSIAFQEQVWPVIAPACGGGELVPVESVVASGFSKILDTQAGIDAWQIVGHRGIRGIASRVQWAHTAFNTFTIRYERDSGAPTEYEKRLLAITKPGAGWLIPHFTVQAYLRPEGDELLSVGVCRTKDLICYLRDGQPDAEYYFRRTSNARFMCVDWSRYRDAGKAIWSHEPAPKRLLHRSPATQRALQL